MISLPIYAFFAHFVTLLCITTFFISGSNNRWIIRFTFILSILVITYCVTLLRIPDYGIYLKIFEWVDTSAPLLDQPRPFTVEIGYLGLNYFVKMFTNNFDIIRFGIIFAALLIKVLFLLRWGKFYLISFLFYLAFIWYADSYILRSSFAASLSLIGIWAILDKRSAFYFFLPVILASSFHVSVLVLLPFWWLRRLNLSQTSAYVLFVLIIISGFIGLGHGLVNFIAGIFSVDIALIDRLIEYSGSKYAGSVGLLRASVIMYILITAAYIFFREAIIQNIPHYNFILLMLLFGLLLLLGFSDFEVLADRLFRLIAFFYAIALGHIFYCLQKQHQLILFIFVIFICNIFLYFQPGQVPFL
jgi:hypothetical protein